MTSIAWFLTQAEEQVERAEREISEGGQEGWQGEYLFCAWALWRVVLNEVQHGAELDPELDQRFTTVKLKFVQFANYMRDETEWQ